MNHSRTIRPVLPCLLLFAVAVSVALPWVEAQQRRRGPAAQRGAAATQERFKGIFEPVSYPEDLRLLDVFFVSDTEGWVSGAGGTILYTKDAGATWTPQLGGDPAAQADWNNAIWRLQFLDNKHGWARTPGGKLLRTTDGQNWQEVNQRVHGHAPMQFTSPANGVYVTSEDIFHTTDGGKTWKKAYSCALKVQHEGMTRNVACHFEALHFPTAQVGYALSREVAPGLFAVARTGDGGATWEVWTVESEHDAKDGDVYFLDENTGYALLGHFRLHRTADGGKTWTGVPTPTLYSNMNGKLIQFADGEVGWAPFHSNGHHLAWTTDGGKRWLTRPVALPFEGYINAFSLPSRQRGYVVGDHGAIFRYSVVPANDARKGVAAPAMPARTGTP